MRLSWLEPTSWQQLVSALPGRLRGASSIGKIIRRELREIVVYHACRPVNVASYYAEGLRLADYSELLDKAKQIFLDGAFPELTEEMLDLAAAELSDFDNQRAYVALDSRGFTAHSGHYLIYGSEYICAIAANIEGARFQNYQRVLKAIGTPTILRLHLPVEHISEGDLQQFEDLIARNIRLMRDGRPLPETDFSFELTRLISGDHVISHEHPTKIIDLLDGMTLYRHLRQPSSE